MESCEGSYQHMFHKRERVQEGRKGICLVNQKSPSHIRSHLQGGKAAASRKKDTNTFRLQSPGSIGSGGDQAQATWSAWCELHTPSDHHDGGIQCQRGQIFGVFQDKPQFWILTFFFFFKKKRCSLLTFQCHPSPPPQRALCKMDRKLFATSGKQKA